MVGSTPLLEVWQNCYKQNEYSLNRILSSKQFQYGCLSQICIPSKQISCKFLWSGQTPRIGYQSLTLPKPKGGISLLYFQKYYWACHLYKIVDWNVHDRSKDWISLEQTFVSGHINSVPWVQACSIPMGLKTHPLIGATLWNFDLAPCVKAFHSLASSIAANKRFVFAGKI